MADKLLPWQACDEGVQLAVRLTPRGGKDAIEGVETLSDGRSVLKARVRAVPENGKANTALMKLVADACAVAPAQVTLASGATARVKNLRVQGDFDALARALARAAGLKR
ncbi:DUF167 family protein [uncultured Alsobacter sp.]|uniref:DUF167 family protein n=1 Tax=uncultured Alsobacter sp. TaxID=1748258 RepID=UPI0025D44691|nr:DUF167 family protein [uncultured Alsobacter sp.]